MPFVACIPAPLRCNICMQHCIKSIVEKVIFLCFFAVSPIPEISPGGQDSVSAMCQQLSRGLSLLSSSDDFGPMPSSAMSVVAKQLFTSTTISSPPGRTFAGELRKLYWLRSPFSDTWKSRHVQHSLSDFYFSSDE